MSNSKKIYKATRSTIAENMFYIDGKPVRFTDYPFQKSIYDTPARALLLKTGRQIGKSTLAANFMIAECMAIPFFKTLFVGPTKEQTSKFSFTRLSKLIQYSPLVRQKFKGATDNVFLKILANGSEIILNYAQDDADRIRGTTANRIFLDEVQDMELQVIEPVIKEVSANVEQSFDTYAGTPKSMENGIEWLWQKSTQTEWIMKCDGCGKYNYITSEKSIGLHGLICVKCGHGISPRNGLWYDMNPNTPENKVRIKGFHVPSVILPRNIENPERWDRVIEKLENYPPQQFKNEVLGISDAIGTRLISESELREMCEPYEAKLVNNPNEVKKLHPEVLFTVGGADWSGGGTTGISRTVAWVWGYTKHHKLKTLYFKIFPGRNQIEDVEEVAAIFKRFGVVKAGGDAGEGAVANSVLKNKLGDHRMFQLQYAGLSQQFKWNKKDRFLLDKTSFIDSFMLLLKSKGVIFPNERQSKPAFDDVLNEFEEVTNAGNKVWRHSPSSPDDSLHAMVFGWTMARVHLGELKLYDGSGV